MSRLKLIISLSLSTLAIAFAAAAAPANAYEFAPAQSLLGPGEQAYPLGVVTLANGTALAFFNGEAGIGLAAIDTDGNAAAPELLSLDPSRYVKSTPAVSPAPDGSGAVLSWTDGPDESYYSDPDRINVVKVDESGAFGDPVAIDVPYGLWYQGADLRVDGSIAVGYSATPGKRRGSAHRIGSVLIDPSGAVGEQRWVSKRGRAGTLRVSGDGERSYLAWMQYRGHHWHSGRVHTVRIPGSGEPGRDRRILVPRKHRHQTVFTELDLAGSHVGVVRSRQLGHGSWRYETLISTLGRSGAPLRSKRLEHGKTGALPGRYRHYDCCVNVHSMAGGRAIAEFNSKLAVVAADGMLGDREPLPTIEDARRPYLAANGWSDGAIAAVKLKDRSLQLVPIGPDGQPGSPEPFDAATGKVSWPEFGIDGAGLPLVMWRHGKELLAARAISD